MVLGHGVGCVPFLSTGGWVACSLNDCFHWFSLTGWSSEAEAMLRTAFRLSYKESAADSSATRTRRLQSVNTSSAQCAWTRWRLLGRTRSEVFPVHRTENRVTSTGEPGATSSKCEGGLLHQDRVLFCIPDFPSIDTKGGFNHMALLPWPRPYLESAMMEQ